MPIALAMSLMEVPLKPMVENRSIATSMILSLLPSRSDMLLFLHNEEFHINLADKQTML